MIDAEQNNKNWYNNKNWNADASWDTYAYRSADASLDVLDAAAGGLQFQMAMMQSDSMMRADSIMQVIEDLVMSANPLLIFSRSKKRYMWRVPSPRYL